MKKMSIYIILALLTIALGIVYFSCSLNPLRKSEAVIRNTILQATPIGMNIDDVLSTIENKDWETAGINHSRGVSSVEFQQLNEDVGSKLINANIGEYGTFLRPMFWCGGHLTKTRS